jgi:hypothetical protein
MNKGKVTLINGIFNTLRISEPIGICSIASTLREKGYEIHIIEPRLMELDIESTARLAHGLHSLYTGISTFSFEKDKLFELADRIKSYSVDNFIVVGGLGPTLTPEIYLDGCSSIDAVLCGEGEYTNVILTELLLEGGTRWKECPGIAYKDNGEIMFGPIVEKIHNLDELPFMTRDILQMNINKYGKNFVSASIMGSRGCFGDCSYCWIAEAQEKQPGLRYRLRSVESIVAEIAYIVNTFGVTDFSFEDDNFLPSGNAGVMRSIKLRDELKKAGLKITFFMQTRPDTLNEVSLTALKEAGLKKLFIGIEAVGEDDLELYNKQYLNRKSVEDTIDMLIRQGFNPNVGNETQNRLRFGYIAFHQLTTLSSLKSSVAFFKKYNLTPKRLLTKVNYFEGDIDIKKKLKEKGMLAERENDNAFVYEEIGLIYKYIKKYADNVLTYREAIRDIEKHVFRSKGNKDGLNVLSGFRSSIDESFYSCFNELILEAETKKEIAAMEAKMENIIKNNTTTIIKELEKKDIGNMIQESYEKYGVVAGMHNIYW